MQVCAPLFDMISRWVFEGELEDPRQEFFVCRSEGDAKQHDTWRHGYYIEGDRLPPFVSQDLALKILRSGKSINFLREVCGDSKWVQERMTVLQAASAQALTYGELDTLERVVASASAEVDERLMWVLSSRFHLARHLAALRDYLLLGKGDFVQALMDLMWSELNQDAARTSELQLNGLLRQAIATSNAKYDEEEVQDNLRVKVARPAGEMLLRLGLGSGLGGEGPAGGESGALRR